MYKRKLKPEEKIAAVESYLSGRESVRSIVERYGVHKETFRAWVRNYETFGKEGLLDKHQKASYSKEVRMAAVKEYLAGGQSQAAICKKYKIYSRKQLHDWIKVYNSHRELRTNSGRGSGIYMTKGRNTTYEERVEIVSYCIANGNDYTATIEKYGVSYQQIYAWVRKYNEKGPKGLLDKRGKRKPEAEMNELEKLRAANRLLEAQNRRLEMENAVLKKLEEIERRCR
jgi:transposase-like protein